MIRDEATIRQVKAARPESSTWVAANAGSGKTRVLTDRVARLLLEGVPPERILCLTYTKAAASEMQNRLFRRLGEWTMRPDAQLRNDLTQLGIDHDVNANVLKEARRLFARAIEAPGGLKIQTIHSFCAALLRRFPLEAGISPRFTEIEDRSAQLLRDAIVEAMADDPATVGFVDDLAFFQSGESFERLLSEITKHKALFTVSKSQDDIRHHFDVSPDETTETLSAKVFLGSEQNLLSSLIPALQQGSSTDQKVAKKLKVIQALSVDTLPELEQVFLFGKDAAQPFSAKVGKFPTKSTQGKIADILPEVDAFMRRVEAARPIRLALAAMDKTLALHRFANEFLPRYEHQKLLRGWLDFDDLINRASQLLHDPSVAQWVLFRLDGGIDHILVDEAQDTSPQQWQVIERLAQEFTSGQGARQDVQRTIFVVGDPKQSIYSFQGADPTGFNRMRHLFQDRLAAVELPFQSVHLEHSFRSAKPILQLVDQTFETYAATGLGDLSQHKAFKSSMPGRVDLWPAIEPTQTKEELPWYDPVDRLSETHQTVLLAKQLATRIKSMIDHETLPDEDGTGAYHQRRVRPGDILILVQQRKELFREIIQACKSEGLPIAGADRLKIGGELAVKDIMAVLSFLALPEDDLSLACALRSPLFGWSEQDLFDLAHKRTDKYLWRALQNRKDEFRDTVDMLEALRNDADYLRPYDLIERLLIRFDGRKKLLARLGPEAEDGIDALLSQALAYERTETPTLTSFLTWLETDDVEIKRQLDSASDLIRVMTVHGAKGLEAPIVILPDCADRPVRFNSELVPTEDFVFWAPMTAEQPDNIRTRVSDLKKAQQHERLRLLYVAMTRAEKWLIVCAAGKITKTDQCWHWLVEQGMEKCGAAETAFDLGPGRRLETGDWFGQADDKQEQLGKPAADLPAFFKTKAKSALVVEKPLTPSDLGGPKALATEVDAEADPFVLDHGNNVHLLLEYLPRLDRDNWRRAADQILKSSNPLVTDQAISLAFDEATSVLDHPDLAFIFDENALAEVPVIGTLSEYGDRKLHGVIDRLIVRDTTVLAIDFKTNREIPQSANETPIGLLRQMRAYQAALEQIYPEKTIQTAILWTKNGRLMSLPHDIVRNAFSQHTVS
ncbi:double-strand break repair helicase AddA [Pseudaestuariivita rosea]|uniref:double-strand break repair helicase AddA n=1 Tax=Pseudaestuariivita rosea TaxID=2763263 RepID=UPI00301403B0